MNDTNTREVRDLTLEPPDNERLANLCGPLDEHLRELERRLMVRISNRGHEFIIEGEASAVRGLEKLLHKLYASTAHEVLNGARVHLALQESGFAALREGVEQEDVAVRTRRVLVRARGPNQSLYLGRIDDNDISFGVGPAGTGKTYLAVARAVEALESESVRRLVLVRPAVEAGERLGFLPGDLAQKVDPYLRPLYDALYEMVGFERVARLIERNVIEVAPLAYMRGRTLNESFILLDEAQNTTVEQMKMFLTRIGFGSKAVVTGDITQVDLPRSETSGLRHVTGVLRDIPGISFTFFESRDVVRHRLVARILDAYEAHDANSSDDR
jgi:phosphate starvation-inducible protein PhoH and related proteins